MSYKSAVRYALAYAACTVLLSVALLAVASGALASERAACAEDAPCWNWATMGNRHRGIVLRSGRLVTVGPCGYARARRAHKIDRARTPRLKGDASARCRR